MQGCLAALRDCLLCSRPVGQSFGFEQRRFVRVLCLTGRHPKSGSTGLKMAVFVRHLYTFQGKRHGRRNKVGAAEELLLQAWVTLSTCALRAGMAAGAAL